MKLLLIPFEDHFSNLINIIKLTLISILIVSTTLASEASGSDKLIGNLSIYLLLAKNVVCLFVLFYLFLLFLLPTNKDYSLDALTKTCTNVYINLTNEAKQGVLHSPAYYAKSSSTQSDLVTKCKWYLNAPANHQLDLT